MQDEQKILIDDHIVQKYNISNVIYIFHDYSKPAFLYSIIGSKKL